jgi:hypothetical protein
MPANYCLRAIPLAAGRHFFLVKYLPWGFVVGKWVSLLSVGAFLRLLGYRGHNYFDRRQRTSS